MLKIQMNMHQWPLGAVFKNNQESNFLINIQIENEILNVERQQLDELKLLN